MRSFAGSIALLAFALSGCSQNPTPGNAPGATSASLVPSGGASHPQSVVANNGTSITVTGPVLAVRTKYFTVNEGSGGGNVRVKQTKTTTYSGARPFRGENVVVSGTGTFGKGITASTIAQQVVVPGGTLSLSGTISNGGGSSFTIDTSSDGYVNVSTNGQTKIDGGTPAKGVYAQAVGPGSASETATYVALWTGAPSSVTASGTVAAITPFGFTLDVSPSNAAVPVALSSSTQTSSWPVTVGGQVSVTGMGSLSQGVVATSLVAANPNPTATPQPIVLSPGGVIGEDDQFVPPDGDTPSGANGQTVDGMPCAPQMYSEYHVHAYLGLLVNGTQIAIPDQIGFDQPGPIESGYTWTAHCYYYIHFHDATGMIHVESPNAAPFDSSIYTLGNVLDVWGETITADSFGPYQGPVRVFYAQVPLKAPEATTYSQYDGDPTTLPIYSHEAIWIEVGPTFVFPPNIPPVEFYTEY
jgi:hypothetical protein